MKSNKLSAKENHMIYDKLEHIETYTGISERLARGLRLLTDPDLITMAPGRYEVDGDNLFFMVQSYESNVSNDTPEAHQKYIDIQYLVSGEELIGVGELADMTEEVKANPEKDLWLYHGPLSQLRLGNGYFTVLFPQDAHAPGIAVSEPAPVKKVVIKVRI